MPFLDDAAIVVSRASRGGLGWALAAGALAARRRDPGLAVRTMGAAWTADVLALLLSRAIGRERPCRTSPSLLDCPDSPSLPSNHSATAGAAAAVLASLAPEAAPLAGLAAAAVAASRVRVGVHHVGDVVAGLVLGVVVATPFS